MIARTSAASTSGTSASRRYGIVIGDAGPRVGEHHAQGGQQQGHGLRGHRRAPISMDDELVGVDLLALAALADEHLGQGRTLLAARIQPTTYRLKISSRDIEVAVGPLGAEELGDVPAPDLIGAGRCAIGLLGRPASEFGRRRHGDGGLGRGARRWSPFMSTIPSPRGLAGTAGAPSGRHRGRCRGSAYRNIPTHTEQTPSSGDRLPSPGSGGRVVGRMAARPWCQAARRWMVPRTWMTPQVSRFLGATSRRPDRQMSGPTGLLPPLLCCKQLGGQRRKRGVDERDHCADPCRSAGCRLWRFWDPGCP